MKRASLACLSVVLVFAAISIAASPATVAGTPESVSNQVWVATWGASPVAPVPPPSTTNTPSQFINAGFTNQTVRLIVHTSIGGNEVRIRLSNVFGTGSLVVGAAHVALRSKDAVIVPESDRPITFSGSSSFTIPPGALAVSDPVQLSVPAVSDLAVSLYLPGPTGQSTWHSDATGTNYVSATGDFTASPSFPVDRTAPSWFYLMDVEVSASKDTKAIIALGDSITDGFRSTKDANHRWPDVLAERLAARSAKRAVVNEGIGGNRILHDLAGPNALARFDRDVLTQPGAAYVIVLLGINDIGQSVTAHPDQAVTAGEIISGHRQMIARAHAQGLKVIGCTLPPFDGAHYFTPEGETKREAVNDFIRTGGAYDGVADFDAAIRDPHHPNLLLAIYDSGDHLHPNDAGYKAMADAIDLSLFAAKRGR
jgi:lysophospholipase L1-like esterase